MSGVQEYINNLKMLVLPQQLPQALRDYRVMIVELGGTDVDVDTVDIAIADADNAIRQN